MGIGNTKLKKKANQTIIANSNASEFLNAKTDNDALPADDYYEESVPVLKWHKANLNEGMIKIQREAEIRDIEAIYENSCIKDSELFNLMPDHYWTGKENKLPRYFRYQGNYPDLVDKYGNLERMKSSSLNDLIDSNINFKVEDNHNADVSVSHRTEISVSCPNINTASISRLPKSEKSAPKKGILKNRNICRANSTTLLDNKIIQLKPENVDKNEFFTENVPSENLTFSRKRNGMIAPTNAEGNCVAEITNNHSPLLPENVSDNNTNSAFSGYFDLSPTRIPGGSLQILKVNIDRKSLIKNNLDKRLNLRPTSVELTNRNILHDQNEINGQCDFEKTKCVLNEKLSVRPTINELKKKRIIKFNDFIEVQETDNYDRSVNKTWNRLTEHDKEHIRLELNQFKEKEMKIHSKSKRFTKFHDMRDD